MHKSPKTWHLINVIIIALMIVVPTVVLASLPTTTSFDRHNLYDFDGYRDGGYYVVRKNSSVQAFMNMSHVGGTNEFDITSYNINNITFNLDLMYERRRNIFGWGSISFEEMISALNGRIIINLDSVDGLEAMRFVDHPEVNVMVWVDGVVVRDWSVLQDVEVYLDGLPSGQTKIILDFGIGWTFYDAIWNIGIFVITIGVIFMVLRLINMALFHDGNYYKSFWGKK